MIGVVLSSEFQKAHEVYPFLALNLRNFRFKVNGLVCSNHEKGAKSSLLKNTLLLAKKYNFDPIYQSENT